MKPYRVFVAYLSIACSGFSYAGLSSPVLLPLPGLRPALPTTSPAASGSGSRPSSSSSFTLPAIKLPEGPPSSSGSASPLIMAHRISGTPAENPNPFAPSQDLAHPRINVQGLLTLEDDFFIYELNRLYPLFQEMELKSLDDIVKIIPLFSKIAQKNPQKDTSDFKTLYLISYEILNSSYKYFFLQKQEPLFLLLFYSTLIDFSKSDHVGVSAMCNFYNVKSSTFENQSFYNSYQRICQKKLLGTSKILTNNDSESYTSLFFDKGPATQILPDLMPVLYILFEKMLNKVNYFELGTAIINILNVDQIVQFYPLYRQNIIDLAFILIGNELKATEETLTHQNKERVVELLSIAINFAMKEDTATKILPKLMPALYILFEKILKKVNYFELGIAIINILNVDKIAKFYPLYRQNAIDLVFILLEKELEAAEEIPTHQSIERVLKLLSIVVKFAIKEDSTPPKKEDPTPPKKEDPTPPEKEDPTPPEKEDPTPPEKEALYFKQKIKLILLRNKIKSETLLDFIRVYDF